MKNLIFEIPNDLWVDMAVSNKLNNQDLIRLGRTCRHFAQLIKSPGISEYIEKKHYARYVHEKAGQNLSPRSLSWSCDSSTLACVSNDGYLSLWDTKSGKKKSAMEINADRILFHPRKPALLASWGRQDSLKIWNVEKKMLESDICPDSSSTPTGCAFHPRGFYLATTGEPGQVHLWKMESNSKSKIFSTDPSVLGGICFAAKGTKLVASSDQAINIWDIKTSHLVKFAIQSLGIPPLFAITPDHLTMIISTSTHHDYFIYSCDFGDLNLEKPKKKVKVSGFIHQLLLHPTKKLMITRRTELLQIWQSEPLRLIKQFSFNFLYRVPLVLSPDGTALAVTLSNESVVMLDVRKYVDLIEDDLHF